MTDNIKLPPLPEKKILKSLVTQGVKIEFSAHSDEALQDYAREAVRLNAAPVPDWFRVTEEMHVAARKVLTRANGLDGLPQRMVNAMLAAAPEPQGVPEQPTQRANRIAFERAIEALDELEAAARGDEPFPHFAGPLIRQTLAMLSGQTCDVPPDGWYCTREKGHSGPCAAAPGPQAEKICELCLGVGTIAMPKDGELVDFHCPGCGSEPQGVPDPATHPMQPVVVAQDGCHRFLKNAMVDHLYEWACERGMGLNEMAAMDFSPEDRMQFAQLIGYSVSGYGELSYVTDESYEKAAKQSKALAAHPQQSGEQPKGRNCPGCKFSDSWGIASKACEAQCAPTADGKGANFQPLNGPSKQSGAAQPAEHEIEARLKPVFRAAMDWGRSYGSNPNLPNETREDVSAQFAEVACKVLAAIPPAQPTPGNQGPHSQSRSASR